MLKMDQTLNKQSNHPSGHTGLNVECTPTLNPPH